MKLFDKTLKSALLASTVMIVPQAAFSAENAVAVPQQDLEEIIVTGRFIPDEKRSTSEISSVIDAGDMSAAGDSDVAVALTRLPGISPDPTGKYIVVRGLSERYTSTLLNGTQLPSPDPLKNAVPLDIFPTSMVKSVLVQKTYSAEYPASFGGGIVDIRSKVVPEESYFTVGFDLGYNTESTFKKGLGYDGSSTDWLGVDDGKRDLPEWLELNPTMDGFTPEQVEMVGESLPNIWSIDEEPNYADLGFDISGGTTLDTDNVGQIGIIFALDYGSKFRNKYGQQNVYSASDATESGLAFQRNFTPSACEAVGVTASDCGYQTTVWDIDLNGFFSLGWQFDESNSIKFNSLLLRSSQQQVEMKQGSTNSRDLAHFTRLDWKERQVLSNGLFGEHSFYWLEQETVLDWYATYVDASRNVPLRRRYEYFYDDVDGLFRLSGRTDGNSTEFGTMSDNAMDVGMNIVQPTVIWDMDVDLKVGGGYLEKDRMSDYKRYGFDLGNVQNGELRLLIPEIVFGTFNIDPNGIYLREYIDASDHFDANFKNTQFYGQMDAQLTETVRFSGGARYEDSTQTVESVDRTTKTPILISQKTDAWLPSGTLTWEFADNMQVRFGYSQTLNRPDSRELSPARFVREDGRTEEGNPLLTPSDIKNYDMRFEWYIGDGESVTVGAFAKEIIDPIEYSIKPIGDGELDTIANAESAKLKGIEIEGDFILGEWQDREIFLRANGSYIDSEVVRNVENFGQITNLTGRLQGQSKWLANVQFGFENLQKGERANLVFNYIGKRIYRLGTVGLPDLIERPPVEVNFVYAYEFEVGESYLTFSFKAKNLLNQAAKRTQGPLIVEAYDVGRTFSIGFSYDF